MCGPRIRGLNCHPLRESTICAKLLDWILTALPSFNRVGDMSDWKSLYPFKSNFLDIDGMNYHYVDEGEGDPVVMVHGNPTWSFYYRNLIEKLSSSHRAIAVDHIGCGLSDRPQKYGYRFSDHISNLSKLMQTIDTENGTLVVHDWGGPIGLGALLHNMHRFKKVVLLNTGAFIPDVIPAKLKLARSRIFGRIAVQGFNRFILDAFKTGTNKHEIWTDEMKAGYLHPYRSWADRVAIYQFVRAIPVSPSHPTTGALKMIQGSMPKLAEKRVKMIWGMKDWVFSPAVLEKMKELLPHAEVTEIADAGHFVLEDAKDQVIDEISAFINEP